MMKRISSLLTLYIFIYTVALAQFQNPVAFSVTQKQTGDNVLEVVFQGTIDAGWHVYGTDIADGGPTRAELTLEKQKGLKSDGKLRAAGKVQKKMDEMFGMEVSYMEGTASFVQRFTITEPTEPATTRTASRRLTWSSDLKGRPLLNPPLKGRNCRRQNHPNLPNPPTSRRTLSLLSPLKTPTEWHKTPFLPFP